MKDAGSEDVRGGSVEQRDADLREAVATLTLRERFGLSDREVHSTLEEVGSAVVALENPARVRRRRRTRGRGRTTRSRETVDAEELIARGAAVDLEVLAVGATGYPRPLRDLGDPPSVLWTCGDASVFALPCVAVVGARRATESGRRVAYEIGLGLARSGLVVVSGMALGVDGAAHEGALAGGGLTVAVLGSGADRPTPGSHRRLYGRICRSGCVVSEFDPGTPAAPYHFPRRNRVIAGLAFAVVVVEAAQRSGALITVDHALDLGRTVFAAPGPLDRPQSAGTNALIRDGAHVVTSVAALVEQLQSELGRMPRHAPNSGSPVLPPAGRIPHDPSRSRSSRQLPGAVRLRELLADGPAGIDELARRSGVSVRSVAASLLEMELGGEVRLEGQRYRRIGR